MMKKTKVKKIRSLLAAVFCAACIPVSAEIDFDNLALNSDNSLLFTVNQVLPGTPEYKSLFVTKLSKTGIAYEPEILTCFPEKMELLQEGKILQVRNRYGTAEYNIGNKSLKWESETNSIPVEYTHIGAVSVSPDGKWLCCNRKTKNAAGQLILVNTLTKEEQLLVENNPFSYEEVNVKWAPDSNALLYEKNGSIYFITPGAAFKNVQLPEEYRKIGEGYINSVQWTKHRSLIYINGDIIYSIQENELYTRGLYSALVGNGNIIGRLPFSFDSVYDDFFCDDSGKQLVIITSDNMLNYCSTGTKGYEYVNIKAVYPLTGIEGSVLGCDVFWNDKGLPFLWIDILKFENGRKSSFVYSLYGKMEQILSVNNSQKPLASPNGKNIAFTSGNSLYIYDLNEWKQKAVLSGEKIYSYIWKDNSTIFAGGQSTCRQLKIDYKNGTSQSTVEFLSSAGEAFWDGGKITVKLSSGTAAYVYDTGKNSWNETKKESAFIVNRSEKNGSFRVFLGISENKNFLNSILVRSLSGNVLTYSVFKETEQVVGDNKKVALIFDAMDSAEGLPEILSVLSDFNIKGTFFINGEFIRRYPLETKQIASTENECASGFYSTADLTAKNFVIDSDFIKRGLARNEDEFFAATGKELGLLWHAPYYHSNELMRKAGDDAGYRYADAFVEVNDRLTFEECASLNKKYLSSGELIDSLVQNLKDGMIIPVSVGKCTGTRKDYLYEKVDLLISAILDAGYEIVPVRVLLNK